MKSDPTHDYDRHDRQQNEAANAEAAFYQAHGDKVLATVNAILASGRVYIQTDAEDIRHTIDLAAFIVREVVERAEPA